MPDAWETGRGLNPQDKSDATKFSARGYLNIEDYINSLIPAVPLPVMRNSRND
jgi:hypothetical protein